MKKIAVILLLVFCQSSVSCYAGPDKASKIIPIGKGLTHFYFTDWAGPRVPVWVYVPHDVDVKSAPIMFLMHGAKRAPARYLSEWDQIADVEGFIVVAPEFTKEDFPGSPAYNHGNVFNRDYTQRNKEDVWSFSAIEPVFDVITASLGSNQKQYTLYGHSAGSQFSHRLMYAKPDARVKRFLLANAGWYTLPLMDRSYPEGLDGLGVSEEHLKAVLSKDVVLLLGDKDNDASHSSLPSSEAAKRQGPHRFARGKYFYNLAKTRAEELGVPFGWKMRVIEGVAHSNGGIAADSGDLVE